MAWRHLAPFRVGPELHHRLHLARAAAEHLAHRPVDRFDHCFFGKAWRYVGMRAEYPVEHSFLELAAEYVDVVPAEKAEAALGQQPVPKCFQPIRRAHLADIPKQTDHLAVRPHLRTAGPRAHPAHQRADRRVEAFPDGLVRHHEACQDLGSLGHDEPSLHRHRVEIAHLFPDLVHDLRATLRRCDHNPAAGAHPLRHKPSGVARQRAVIGAELYYVSVWHARSPVMSLARLAAILYVLSVYA